LIVLSEFYTEEGVVTKKSIPNFIASLTLCHLLSNCEAEKNDQTSESTLMRLINNRPIAELINLIVVVIMIGHNDHFVIKSFSTRTNFIHFCCNRSLQCCIIEKWKHMHCSSYANIYQCYIILNFFRRRRWEY
jgi:hypothetical protein